MTARGQPARLPASVMWGSAMHNAVYIQHTYTCVCVSLFDCFELEPPTCHHVPCLCVCVELCTLTLCCGWNVGLEVCLLVGRLELTSHCGRWCAMTPRQRWNLFCYWRIAATCKAHVTMSAYVWSIMRSGHAGVLTWLHCNHCSAGYMM